MGTPRRQQQQQPPRADRIRSPVGIVVAFDDTDSRDAKHHQVEAPCRCVRRAYEHIKCMYTAAAGQHSVCADSAHLWGRQKHERS
jgi:hypothetical protein